MNPKHFIFLLLLLLTACRSEEKHYVIGVSQCMDDAWRRKMNTELETEHTFYPEVTLRYRQADSNSELQCQQIDSFIQEGIDLLIVSPNEADEVEPAVSRAYRAGIPVVVADRRLRGEDYTAFVGGDNKQVGYIIAHYLLGLAEAKGDSLRVIEVQGLPGSTPTVLRHQAMLEGIRVNPLVRVVAEGCGQWLEPAAESLTDSLLIDCPKADVIVAQNDLMARGAAAACRRHRLQIPIVGVDGMTGPGGGVEAILEGLITVTATYPSRGDLVFRRAMQILQGEDYPRNTVLKSVMLGRDEAEPVAQIAEERAIEMAAINEQRRRIFVMTNQYKFQRAVTITMFFVLIGVILVITYAWHMYICNQRLRREQEEAESKLHQQQEQLSAMSEQLAQSCRYIPTPEEMEKAFIDKLCHEIEAHLSNPELSVELLADSMGMSRSALFRRVKSALGQSPVELIRTLRLERARRMLEKGSMNVQQVAYEVGFSSPGYFATCYKEKYGVSPGDGKNRS